MYKPLSDLKWPFVMDCWSSMDAHLLQRLATVFILDLSTAAGSLWHVGVDWGLSVVVDWINLVLVVLDKFWYIYTFLVEGSSKNPSTSSLLFIRYKYVRLGHRDFLDHETNPSPGLARTSKRQWFH
jgi:hypothetical protein